MVGGVGVGGTAGGELAGEAAVNGGIVLVDSSSPVSGCVTSLPPSPSLLSTLPPSLSLSPSLPHASPCLLCCRAAEQPL